MKQEVHANERICDVGHHEPPNEIPAETKVETERQTSVGVDGSTVISTEVVVNPVLASRNEPGVWESGSTRNCRLLSLPEMKRRPVVLLQPCAAVDVHCVTFPEGNKRMAEYSLGPGL
jgi:hypothetical protein